MILTDEAAAVIIALIIGAVLVVLAIMGFGAFLASRGNRLLGIGIMLAVVAAVTGPGVMDRVRNVPLRADLEARQSIPETLDLTGRRVLFIETGSTLCGQLCGDAVQVGTQFEAYWVGAGGFIPNTFSDNPLRDVLDGAEHVRQIQLAPPNEDLSDQRFAEPEAAGNAPPYDVVIVVDDSSLIGYVAPHLLGDPLPDGVQVLSTVLVFTDWPDPFAGPPPSPAYRSVIGGMSQRHLLRIPFAGNNATYPPFGETDAAWTRLICASAGPAQDRDAFTYTRLCAARDAQ